MISPSETRDLIIYDIFHKIKYLRFDPEHITTIDIGGSLFRCYLNIHFTKSLLFSPKKTTVSRTDIMLRDLLCLSGVTKMEFEAVVLNPAMRLVIEFGLVKFVKRFGAKGKAGSNGNRNWCF
jgi:hypothetical protein